MYSLALLAFILLSTALFSGPISLALTYLHLKNNVADMTRKVFLTILAAVGIFISIGLFTSSRVITAQFIAIMGLLTSVNAIKREHFPNFRFRGPTGTSSGNDGSGPAGQS
ncbi:MAG: hypothetical protein F2704_03760 [Actinobacteria bacterium]|uniref:Unannotated protein n=1 Tax=freshwater metagenome TaxID=449393 RepID=A0A6J6TUQ3_9ZZZZ|nr:hypothetical protein [Actinomycetota bacterium]MSW47831.1 hypothetical protein [Actinomycetota bacterium]MSX25003.1 hypothetical protein [Actinomycetota bacterium]MSY46493.1 hypothetical protein [Actinomycetota bacterium]MSY57371.1 hypothetical protein [Actinomycetota bacterium]